MKAARKRQHPEADLQRTVVQYLNVALPRGCWFTAFPAGGGGKIRGAQLKAMGLLPGVADLMIVIPGPEVTWTIWLELKSPQGRLSAAQERFGALIRAMSNMDYIVERSLGGVLVALRRAGVALRARP